MHPVHSMMRTASATYRINVPTFAITSDPIPTSLQPPLSVPISPTFKPTSVLPSRSVKRIIEFKFIKCPKCYGRGVHGFGQQLYGCWITSILPHDLMPTLFQYGKTTSESVCITNSYILLKEHKSIVTLTLLVSALSSCL